MPIYSLSNAYTFHSDTIILYQQQLQHSKVAAAVVSSHMQGVKNSKLTLL